MAGEGLRYRGMKQQILEQAEVRTTTLSVGGMSCGACVRHVSRALNGLSGVVHAEVDLGRHEAIVEHLSSSTDAGALVAAIRDAGYSARVTATRPDAEAPRAPERPATSCGCGGCGVQPAFIRKR